MPEISRAPTRTRPSLAAAALALALVLGACNRDENPPQSIEPTRETSCALDGMTLVDYPGPKGQIHYTKGEVDFFCDTMEMMSIYLKPEQQKRIRAIYTQDMGTADWGKPAGHWIDARSAFFVVGGKKQGSMGPTLASFAQQADAAAFASAQGGKVLRFDEITPDMVRLDGGVLHDEKM